MKKAIFLFFLMHYFFSSLFSIEIKHIREFTLFQDDKIFIRWPGSFFITEDDLVFVFDQKASNIKIFNTNGKLVRIFGRRGMGPDEFVKPFFSAYKKPLVAFIDYGRRQIFIYKRTEKNNLKFKKNFLDIDLTYNIHFMNDNKLLIAGEKRDKKGKLQNLYIYDYINHKYNFLLPLEKSYGYNSINNYFNSDVEYLSTFIYCDWTDKSIYHVWTGNINIMKLNRKSGEMTFFGKKTENYIQPKLTSEMRKAFSQRKHLLIYKLRAKMSFIRDLFVIDSDIVALVYVGPLKKNNGVNVMVQLYKSNGEFIKEFEVLNAKASTAHELYFYFKKEKNLFFILDTEVSKNFDHSFKIHEYIIK